MATDAWNDASGSSAPVNLPGSQPVNSKVPKKVLAVTGLDGQHRGGKQQKNGGKNVVKIQ